MTDSLTDLDLMNLIVELDARQARLVRDMANARLRDLDTYVPASERCTVCGVQNADHDPNSEHAFRRPAPSHWHQPATPLPPCEWCGKTYNPICAICNKREGRTAHLPRRGLSDPCKNCGTMRANHWNLPKCRRFVDEGAELQAGLEEAVRRSTEAVDGPDRPEGHVGYTDDF